MGLLPIVFRNDFPLLEIHLNKNKLYFDRHCVFYFCIPRSKGKLFTCSLLNCLFMEKYCRCILINKTDFLSTFTVHVSQAIDLKRVSLFI